MNEYCYVVIMTQTEVSTKVVTTDCAVFKGEVRAYKFAENYKKKSPKGTYRNAYYIKRKVR